MGALRLTALQSEPRWAKWEHWEIHFSGMLPIKTIMQYYAVRFLLVACLGILLTGEKNQIYV